MAYYAIGCWKEDDGHVECCFNRAMSQLVDGLVASCRYQNASEAMRAGLHLLEREEAESASLRARLHAGLEQVRNRQFAREHRKKSLAALLRKSKQRRGFESRSFHRFCQKQPLRHSTLDGREFWQPPSSQADVYQCELVDNCAGLARGDVPSQSCSVLIGAGLVADMRVTRVGPHVVVFVDSNDEIVVTDFVYQREDLVGKVTGMGKRGSR